MASPHPIDITDTANTVDDALQTVRNLLPLKHLKDSEFEMLSTGIELEHCAPPRELFSLTNGDGFIFYLLAGELTIFDADGDSFVINGGSIESKYPLTPRLGSCVKATAKTPVSFLRFPADLMQLSDTTKRNEVAVTEIDGEDGDIDKRVLFDVYHRLMDGDFVLPSLPDVAIRIRNAASDPDVSAETIARLIQADPSTAAYCISVSNSAALAGASEIDNVLDAVVRLGIQSVRDLVIAYTVRSLFNSKNPFSKKMMREAWKHSCRTAALSCLIARDVARLNPERALLAGLLHDIGVIVVIDEISKHTTFTDDAKTFNHVAQELAGQVGTMILRAWQFPEAFTAATLESEHFNKPVADRLSLADVVMLAHLHDRQPAPWSQATMALSELAIHEKLAAYDLNEDSRLAIITEADQELSELTRLLSQ